MENRLSAPGRPYRAVCFDLDGTLLPMDLEEFLQGYFGRLGRYAAEQGEDAEAVMGAVGRSVKAMTSNDGARTNEELFWDFFAKAMGERWEARDWPAFFNDFYEGPFREVGALMTANPAAARAVGALAAKGYPLALTTMPLFPRVAVEERLRWAGVDPSLFGRITTFDNSRSAKPHLGYYAENLRALGVGARRAHGGQQHGGGSGLLRPGRRRLPGHRLPAGSRRLRPLHGAPRKPSGVRRLGRGASRLREPGLRHLRRARGVGAPATVRRGPSLAGSLEPCGRRLPFCYHGPTRVAPGPLRAAARAGSR